MSGRGKYKSMGVSHREGQEQQQGGGGGGGRGRGRGNRFRKTLNGNFIKQGGDEGGAEDSTRPQVRLDTTHGDTPRMGQFCVCVSCVMC